MRCQIGVKSMSDIEEFRRTLSSRTLNLMKMEQITTWEQAAKCTERELLRVPNFGRKSLRELREALLDRGLDFSQNEWEPREFIAPQPKVQAGLRQAWDALHKSQLEIGRVKRRIERLMSESHNATPAPQETANLAEKHNETDN